MYTSILTTALDTRNVMNAGFVLALNLYCHVKEMRHVCLLLGVIIF